MKQKIAYFITGTDTGVGKTLVSIGLCLHFKASYWKPIQTGLPGDTEFVKQFLPKNQIYPNDYELKKPLSPNQASEKEQIKIDLKEISAPQCPFLIVEGIGGVYVPLNDKNHLMDIMKRLAFPLIVVARSGLGTLNHTLLTIEALKRRRLKIAGIILSGSINYENKRDIEKWTSLPVLLEIPPLKKITKKRLITTFKNLKRL